MTEPNVTVRQGDTGPSLRATLTAATGPADLTGATIRLHLREHGTVAVVRDVAATVDDGPAGTVSYEWDEDDLDRPGLYEIEWQVTFTDGTVVTFPNGDPDLLRVTPQIA